jgi:hypothetical protein
LNTGLNLGIGKKFIVPDLLQPGRLSHAATEFVESLKINSISEKKRKERRLIAKRRNPYGERMADLINFYFRLANVPIRFVSEVETWARWETNCFKLLNGDRFGAWIKEGRTALLEKLPGKSLWDHMNEKSLTPKMLRAAGIEYRRAHRLRCDGLEGGWSHADASMTNVIYDNETGRARLIDFEIRHDGSLTAPARRADDLLVFLLDMVGRVESRQWLTFSLSFIRAYDDAEVINELKNRLTVPSGLALLWWNVRTNFTSSAKINRRFQTLRRGLDDLDGYHSARTARLRHKRRPSIHCQVTSAGIPTAKSRQRAIREIANAISPGMPRRLPSTR